MFCRPAYVVDKVFDLFSELGATDAQMDFQIVYASGAVNILICKKHLKLYVCILMSRFYELALHGVVTLSSISPSLHLFRHERHCGH